MQQATLSPIPSPSVSLINGRPATTSLEVAKFFGKRHDNVVRDIESVMSQTPENFLQLNFEESTYEQKTPMGTKQARMFILHRDGFMLLVMGYTGKKAMQIKIAYIEAFNRMEAKLAGQPVPVNMPAGSQKTAPPKPYCTDREMKPLDDAVNTWVKTGKITRLEALAKLRAEFGVTRYCRFWPVQLIQPAIEWVQEQMGERPKASTKALALPPVERLSLSAWDKLEIGPAVIKVLESGGPIGPRTMECVLLQQRYSLAINEMLRLFKNLSADLKQIRMGTYGQVLSAVNTTNSFSDSFMDTLTDDTYRIERMASELYDTAFRALRTSICVAKMVGA